MTHWELRVKFPLVFDFGMKYYLVISWQVLWDYMIFIDYHHAAAVKENYESCTQNYLRFRGRKWKSHSMTKKQSNILCGVKYIV